MTALLTAELIDRCHAGSKAKGFWDEMPDQRQQLMLMAGELAEAQEAHRKGKKVTCHWRHFAPMAAGMADEHDGARVLFVETVKDTPADELADSFIRGCDFAGGFEIAHQVLHNYNQGIYWLNEQGRQPLELPENFGAALYHITAKICAVAPLRSPRLWPDQLADAMLLIQRLAEREGIDLATHIDLKLRYNATRPAKHGKAY